MGIVWSGMNKVDCIANFKTSFEGIDPNAKYYQLPNGEWVIEANAAKATKPGIITIDNGKKVILTPEEYAKLTTAGSPP